MRNIYKIALVTAVYGQTEAPPVGDSDCTAIRNIIYPGQNCENAMVCSSAYSCEFTSDDCNQYQCVSVCQCGDGSVMESHGSYCPCQIDNPGTQLEPFAYDCVVEGNQLKFNIEVPPVNRNSDHDYDTRPITLISGSAAALIDDDGPVTEFGSSLCVAESIDGAAKFQNIVDGVDGCDVGAGVEMTVDGARVEQFNFAVGYDDLYDTDPLGNEVIKRYGRHWGLTCTVDLEDDATVMPDVDGTRAVTTAFAEVELPFELEIYEDAELTTPLNRQIDIGVKSIETQKAYVQGKVLHEDKYLHLKQCEVIVVSRDENQNQISTATYPILENGCLVVNDFINTHFVMDDDRERDTDDFEVDLWDQSVSPETENTDYHFKCTMVGCHALAAPGTAYCAVSPNCAARYNLFTGRRRRQASNDPAENDDIEQVTKEVTISYNKKSAAASIGGTIGGIFFLAITVLFMA